jgi:hypothetical protein
MTRNLATIYTFLSYIAQKDDDGNGIYFIPDCISHVNCESILSLLVQGGLITDLPLKPNALHSLTWKGHCFIDLYDIWKKESQHNNSSTKALIAEIALKSFC